MAAKEGQYYYDSNGGTIGDNEVAGLRVEAKGTTRDGFQLHHFTYHRQGNRISYDTVRINGEYCYIKGSGHTVYDGESEPTRWDWGNRVTWVEAQTRNALDVIET